MILREYDVEPISYLPGQYRVVERFNGKETYIDSGLSYLRAQQLVGIIDSAVRKFIEDNEDKL